METYLIIDIGTGNFRVALAALNGDILHVERENMVYVQDERNQEGLCFDPNMLWERVLKLIDLTLVVKKDIEVTGVTVSSQREGIVLVDKSGNPMIGFPNHDFRGRFLEDSIDEKDKVYRLAGRYPTALFSAFKLAAYRNQYPEEWKNISRFMSISDWGQFMLTGVESYEHAQASETLLYDVAQKKWSDELLEVFELPESILPPLRYTAEALGSLRQEYAARFSIHPGTPVFVGGADTQLAIKSTRPQVGDIILVSGTTTPVVQVVEHYVLDSRQRSWTNSHLNKSQFILETNCGVTGLNFQRIKEIFYPNEGYDVLEKELDQIKEPTSFGHLGSLIANDKVAVTNGGFLFQTPIMTALSRADFAFAALWDIACSIKENYDCLLDIQLSDRDYVWCCGGGFQSRHLRKYVSGLIGKKLLFRPGYEQASVSGAAVVCGEALGKMKEMNDRTETVFPDENIKYAEWYNRWKQTRDRLKKV